MESPNKSSSPLANHQSPPESASPSKRKDFQIIPISKRLKKKSKSSLAQDPDDTSLSYNGDREAEYEDLMREDKNLRTVLHRAALDHDKRIVKQLCQRAEKILDVGAYVNKMDKFGNSPLLSACVYNKINSETDEKLECLKILLHYGAEPNQYNHHNLWSPLTWCAYYGDSDATKLLLEKGAYSFWPDKEGHFPLDHCGLQDDRGNKKETAKVLIDNLFELLIDYENKKHDKTILDKTFGNNVKFLQSPLLRTSLLYWVTYFNLNTREYFGRIIDLDGVYPDLPLNTIFGRNCYHASCISGNKEVLSILLNHKRRFYSMHQRFIRTKMHDAVSGASKSHTEKDELERVFAFSNSKNKKKTIYSKQFVADVKETVAWITAFDHQIDKMVKEENEGSKAKAPNYFEVQDVFGNTPLHFASVLGRVELAKILLENGANIEIENKDGWRCAELKQHKTIEQMYKDHMKKLYDESVVSMMNQRVEAGTINHLPTSKTIQKQSSLQKLLTKSNKVAAEGQLASNHHTELQNSLAKRSKMFLKRRKIPDVVLIFRTKINNDKATTKFIQNRVNFNISLLVNKFDCYLSKDINDSVYYLMIKTNERDLDYQCLKYNIKMKLLNAYGYKLYDPTKKTDFEPFRSRQRAEITLTAINDVLNIQQLKDLKILQEIYPMHTVSGIERIKEIWLNSKWYWPQPLASFRDYLREGKHLNFTPITTLRMYFGESVAFYFAWTSFYTCYLLILAIPGLLVMIFILKDQSNSSFLLPAWVIYNSLCSTLVVEKWKRKAAEIATRWGTLDMLDRKVDQKVLRSEFIGNEIINQNTGALTKDNTKSKTSLYFILSAPILILLMVAVVGTFLLTQSLIADQPGAVMSMIISTLNGTIIAVLNFVYQKLARYFVNKENHKYTYTYEKSLIFKGFLSLFFNSYLGVLYLIFIKNVELEKIYYNLISILITKQATSITTTAVIPWILYKYKQKNYFKAVNARGSEQTKQRRDSVVPNQQENRDGDVANSKDPLIEENPKNKGASQKNQKDQDMVVKRPVLDCKKGIPEADKWDLTRVELNGMKSRNDDFNDDYGQMLIQYGYITMFASAFPIGPLISFIANILDTRAKLFAFLYVYHRPPIQKAAGIGNWQNVWEIMSIIGLFTNALILFFRSTTSFDVFEDALMDDTPGENIYHDVRRLWVFLIIVYVILVLKLLARAFIQDKPQWVINEEEKLKNLEKPEIDIENHQASTLVNLDRSHHKTARTSDGKETPLLKKNHSKNASTLDDLPKTPNDKVDKQNKKSPNKKFFEITPAQSILGSPEVKEVHHSVPKNGLPLSPSIALNLSQGVKSLFFNAFTYIEKELSLKRLECFSSNIEELVIICQGCRKTRAILECTDCQEKHCAQCMRNIHDQTTRKTHKIAYLIKANDNSMNHQIIPITGTARKSISQIQTKDGKSAKEQPPQQWAKLQNFEFPTYVHGDSYINIERVYKILYKIYITENGVSEDNTISDIKAALRFKSSHAAEPQKFGNKPTEQQPGQEGSTAGKSPNKGIDVLAPAIHEEIGEIDHTWFEAIKKFFGVSGFNTEEKMLINRVAFFTFKKRGAKANYNDFYRHMKTLQEGNLETKLMLFFDLIDEDEDGLVSLMQLGSFIDKSLLQDMTNDESYENILKSVLENKKTINKKQFVNGVLNSKRGKQLLMSYLQVKEEKTLVQVKS